jgi:excinuclease ABC subunit A
MQSSKILTLRGVRTHNLKNIDVDIPLDKLTVITGVSGAGKSSLVFDTLYAEAQRRYLQSFSTRTRQFLERFDKPDAEQIGDLPPAVAIRRSSMKVSPRSTVGALSEMDAPLRLLFARAGTLVCPDCGQRVIAQRTGDVLAALQAMPAGALCTIAFPATPQKATDQAAWLAALLEEGYSRIQVGRTTYRLGAQAVPALAPKDKIWILLDRIEIGKTPIERLSESVEAAFRRGQGRIGILTETKSQVFDQRFVCARCERVFRAPEPRLFDANDPLGACSACHGAGVTLKSADVCSACQGRRWNADALAVHLCDRNIADWQALPLNELLALVRTLKLLNDQRAGILLDQVRDRLQSLVALDVGYATLRHPAASLSDGAARRIALTAALAFNLVHVLYLIDEPTTSLHPRDTGKLLDALRRLRERGNTLVVIEHDRQVIASADHVIDLGPGAGEEGGQITYYGPVTGLSKAAENPTSDFWSGRSFIEIPERRRKPTGFLKLSFAGTNNLQNLSVEFPLGVLCAVTGVGGAGKSSLIEQTLYPGLCLGKKLKGAAPSTTAKIIGAQQLADVVLLDQTPLPRSSRSNPATYLKIFDEIRTLFAETVDAKIRNFGPGYFSFNQAGGRCETCEGQGSLTIDMQFLADVTTVCPECRGKRYRKEILDIKVRSRSIAEVLDLTIREACRFFRAQPAIEKKLKVLLDVGLDYLRLGQAVETLAGGECQRLKLAGRLASSRKTNCLFLLIEPTAGLHPADVANLLDCFDRLLSAGHSVIVIEYDLDVIGSADYVIDFGPEGGAGGGRIVAHGTPEEVAEVTDSHTGRFLKTWLGKNGITSKARGAVSP